MNLANNTLSRETSRAPVSQRRQQVDTENRMVSVIIDDISVDVLAGTTILETAAKVNIKIPTLCNHDDLCIAGVCRLCVVEVEGERTRLQC